MSEHFLKLDPYNYNTEIEYLLDNEIYTFEEYKEIFEGGKMSKEDWSKVNEWFNE